MKILKLLIIIIIIIFSFTYYQTKSFNPVNLYSLYIDTNTANKNQQEWCLNELIQIDKYSYQSDDYAKWNWSRNTPDSTKRSFDYFVNSEDIILLRYKFTGSSYLFYVEIYEETDKNFINDFNEFKKKFGNENHIYEYSVWEDNPNPNNPKMISGWTIDNWIMFYKFLITSQNSRSLETCKTWYQLNNI